MNEVREICDQMLAATPPPMRPPGDVLSTARRSAVRRDRAALVSVATLAVAAVAAAVSLTTLTGAGTPPARTPPAEAAAPDQAAPDRAAAEPPEARAAHTHSARMRQLLLAAVPAGYATTDYPVSYDAGFDPAAVLPNERYPAPRNGAMNLAFAGLFLAAGGGEGLLSASIMATGGGVPDRSCSGDCEPVTIAGVTVEVSTWQDEAGRHIAATRRLRGGWLVVIASQGMGGGDGQAPPDGIGAGAGRTRPALAELPFDRQRIAALAADPAMLQFP